MKRKWRFLLLCAAAVAALAGYFFLLPAPAVGEASAAGGPAGRTGFDGVAPAEQLADLRLQCGGLQVPLEESH